MMVTRDGVPRVVAVQATLRTSASRRDARWRRAAARALGVGVLATAAACSPASRSGGQETERTATTVTATTVTATAPTVSSGARPSSTGGTTVSCTGSLDGPDTRRYRDDVEADRTELVSLDVYRRPEATDCPVIVWVHGGGWSVGDKAGKGIETKVDFAAGLGASLVSVNYRLVTRNGDVRWPVMGQDVAAAVAWVIEHAGELGIDPDRVALMGHSAGAHLVSIVATNPDLLEQAGTSRRQVRCVVALDSAAYDITPTETRTRPLFEAAFGDDPNTLADASPLLQAREHPSEIPDTLVVTRGAPARVAEAREFADAVTAAGATGHLVDAGTYTHEQVNTELGAASDTVVTPPTRAFLETCWA